MKKVIALALTLVAVELPAQARRIGMIPVGASELRDSVTLFTTDVGALGRRWTVDYSPARNERFKTFYTDWRARLAKVDFSKLSQEGKVDYVLLDTRLRSSLAQLAREVKLAGEMQPLVPFGAIITDLEEKRRRFEKVDAPAAAKQLSVLAVRIDSLTRAARAKQAASVTRPEKIIALRAVAYLDDLAATMRNWHRFYSGYDPEFSWWTADPFRRTNTAITQYQRAIREAIIGQREGQEEPIIGDPIGAEGLKEDLEAEMIAYTPEDLIALAEREFKWIDAEKGRAARDMGMGTDVKGALEKVKQAYVPPGEQPELIRRLAREAVALVRIVEIDPQPPFPDEQHLLSELDLARHWVVNVRLNELAYRMSHKRQLLGQFIGRKKIYARLPEISSYDYRA